VTQPPDALQPARLVRTIAIIVACGVVLWALWVARGAVLLIYVSVLLAIGLSPAVRMQEMSGHDEGGAITTAPR
jgi:CDP-diglyceride synthetase